jgi:DNA polymerase-1
MEQRLFVAIDTEFDIKVKPFIVTMCDWEMNTFLFYPQKENDYRKIKYICESPDVKKIFHSATTDIFALHNIGIETVSPYHDTFILASILDENYKSKRLKFLAKNFLHEPCLEYRKLSVVKRKMKKELKKDFSWDKIPKDLIEPYAVKDAVYTMKLFQDRYYDKVMSDSKLRKLYYMELDLIPVIVGMMKRGVQIDRKYCQVEIDRLNAFYSYYYNKLFQICGEIFNLNSPKSLRKLLKKADVYIPKKTKTGLVKTDYATLSLLKEEYPVVRYIINCRGAAKQRDTYYIPLLNRYTSPEDPIAHFPLYQSGTKTGRFSAELIQTIPKKESKTDVANYVRKAFIPREDYINLYYDYDQIEMRLFAHFSENQRLIQAILDGEDVHDVTAHDIFTEEQIKENPKDRRRDAKDINFGIIYGMGKKAMAKKLGKSLAETEILFRKYDSKYKMRDFIRRMTSELYRKKHINLEWIGRKYHVPKRFAYKSVNVIVQGSAAYIIKKAMLRIAKYLRYVPGVNLLLQVHDELIFEMHKSIICQRYVADIKHLMEDHDTFAVPITVSVSYTEKSWKEAVPWRFYNK